MVVRDGGNTQSGLRVLNGQVEFREMAANLWTVDRVAHSIIVRRSLAGLSYSNNSREVVGMQVVGRAPQRIAICQVQTRLIVSVDATKLVKDKEETSLQRRLVHSSTSISLLPSVVTNCMVLHRRQPWQTIILRVPW